MHLHRILLLRNESSCPRKPNSIKSLDEKREKEVRPPAPRCLPGGARSGPFQPRKRPGQQWATRRVCVCQPVSVGARASGACQSVRDSARVSGCTRAVVRVPAGAAKETARLRARARAQAAAGARSALHPCVRLWPREPLRFWALGLKPRRGLGCDFVTLLSSYSPIF